MILENHVIGVMPQAKLCESVLAIARGDT